MSEPMFNVLKELADSSEDVWDAYVIEIIADEDDKIRKRFHEALDAAWKLLKDPA